MNAPHGLKIISGGGGRGPGASGSDAMRRSGLFPGKQVARNIRLLSPLGSGSMGSVWRAEHTTLGIEVAVKFIASEQAGETAELVERFKREARAAASIRSPHVVQTLDHGVTDDGELYIVLELLEGETLGDLLDREGVLDLATVGIVVAQVSRALSRAHKLGIVHRDIKPENIFLTYPEADRPFVKLLDFGIAKVSAFDINRKLTACGISVGTVPYMSREQLLDAGNVDASADLWALAVVAYEALTGALPFDGRSFGEVCNAIFSGNFKPPSERNCKLRRSLDVWFAKAFARDPIGRFQTARELADSFIRLVMLAPGARHFADADATGPFVAIPAQDADPSTQHPQGPKQSIRPRADNAPRLVDTNDFLLDEHLQDAAPTDQHIDAVRRFDSFRKWPSGPAQAHVTGPHELASAPLLSAQEEDLEIGKPPMKALWPWMTLVALSAAVVLLFVVRSADVERSALVPSFAVLTNDVALGDPALPQASPSRPEWAEAVSTLSGDEPSPKETKAGRRETKAGSSTRRAKRARGDAEPTGDAEVQRPAKAPADDATPAPAKETTKSTTRNRGG